MLSPRCQSSHPSTWLYMASPDSRMSSRCPWESLIISHYSLPSIIWSNPRFCLLKTEWTHPEWFSALCNMLPLCHSFTSFIHSFIQHTIYWMPVLCWGHRDGQDRVPSSLETSYFPELTFPELTLFIKLPTAEWAIQPTNKGAFIPIPGVIPLAICQLSLSLWTCPKSRPVWKAAWHSGKGGSHGTSWEILGKLLPYSDFDFFTVNHRLRVWSQTA